MTPDTPPPGSGPPSSDTLTTRIDGTLGRQQFKRLVRSLSPDQFEYFVADLWQRLRIGSTTVTTSSGDMGVDVTLDGGTEREVIQAKKYDAENNVGRPEVQQYYALYDQENADRVTIVTTGAVADTAEQWAVEHGVTLIDGDDLFEIVRDMDDNDILLSKWFIDGDYTLANRGGAGLSNGFKGLIIQLIKGIAALGRPFWAVGLIGVWVIFTLATLSGTIAILSGIGPQNAPLTDIMWQYDTIYFPTLFICHLAFPTAAAVHGERGRAKQFALSNGAMLGIALFVTPVIAAVIAPESNIILYGSLALFGLVVIGFAIEDLSKTRSGTIKGHIDRSIAAFNGRPIHTSASSDNNSPLEANRLNPIQYATVPARRTHNGDVVHGATTRTTTRQDP